MPILTIDKNNFLRGASASDYSGEAGFSPDGKGHNIEKTKGVLAPPPTPDNTEDIADGETGLVAAAGDTSTDGIMISADADEDGHYYRINSDGTQDVVGEDTGRDYRKNNTDVIGFDADTYVSSNTNITNNADATPDYDWWTTVAGGSALTNNTVHHFLIFDGELLITDSEKILKWDDVTASTPLTLPMEGNGTADTVKATCFEKYNNKVYICSRHGFETPTTKSYRGNYEMFIWDGVNTDNTLDDRIVLPDHCYAIKNFNGRLLLFFEKYIAIYNGLSFVKIRDISSIIYKSDMIQRGDKLYMAEGNNILVYDGLKFWYLLKTSNDIDCIWNIWGDDLGYVSATELYKIDLDDADANGIWYSNWIDFPTNAIIRSLKIELAEDMASGDVNTIKLVDQEEDIMKTLTASFAVQGAKKSVEFRNINRRCLSLQVQLDTFDNLIKRIIIEYDFTRQPI